MLPLGYLWVPLKKCQPIRSGRLAGYMGHIYSNVLFYYIDYNKLIYLRNFRAQGISPNTRKKQTNVK